MNAPTLTDPKAIARAARDERILELHADGLSEREIARDLNTSRTTVWTVIQKARAAARSAGVGMA